MSFLPCRHGCRSLALGWRLKAEIHHRQVHRKVFGDDLNQLAVDLIKSRAEDFMPPDDLVETLRRCFSVERTSQPYRQRRVVRGAVRFQLGEKPQPLLRKTRR